MSAHKWVLSKQADRYRVFLCEKCGAGPLTKDILSGKSSISKIAAKLGYSNDCNVEVVKKIMDS